MAPPSAVLTGRTFSDVVNNVLVLIVMGLTGLAVGWRIRSSWLEALAGFGLLLVFAYAISWIMAWIGMLVPSPRGGEQRLVHRHLPADVRREHLRAAGDAARAAADLRRVEPGVGRDAGRARAVREHPARDPPVPDVWSLQHPEVYTLIWSGLFLAIFVPLANAQYRVSTSR